MKIPSDPSALAAYLDHTLLSPTATENDIRNLCAEALEHRFRAVCVHGSRLALVASLLEGSDTLPAAVIGFPLGAGLSEAKACEARACTEAGARELDVVANIGWVKSGQWELVSSELALLRETAPTQCLKLILETCYLTREEKVRLCRMAQSAGWDFVKTSTGFGTGGATIEDVELMHATVGGALGVKASGGIRDLNSALAFIEAGASRIGASAGVQIMEEARQQLG